MVLGYNYLQLVICFFFIVTIMQRHSLLRANVASAASTVDYPRSSIVSLLPPSAGIALGDVEAVAASSGSVIKEPELGFEASAVDLTKVSELRFSCGVKLPFLSLHIKDVGRFLMVEVTLLDSLSGELRRLELSNKQSVIRVNLTYASLPLTLVSGWNLVRLDLAAMARAAFGANYAGTTDVTIHGVCRIAKVFFSEKLHEDAELPLFLRAIPLPISPEVLAKQAM